MLRNIRRSLLSFTTLLLLVGITYSLPTVRAALNHKLAGADTHQNSSRVAQLTSDGSLKAKAPGSALTFHISGTGQGRTTPSNATTGPVCTPPTLGNYTATALTLGSHTAVTSDAAPSDATSLTAIAPAGFTGTLTVHPTTGAVSVNNAAPVGSYVVKVYALSNCTSPATSTFTLTVNAAANCSSVSFGASTLSATAGSGSYPYAVAAGDFNGDGNTDLAAANSGASVGILLNNGAGSFTTASSSPISTGQSGQAMAIAAGDFNGDGKLDLAVGDDLNKISILLGDGNGGFAVASGSPISASSLIRFIALGDFNRDGKLDLAATNYTTNNVTILLGDGSGGFSAAGESPIAVGFHPYSVVVGDFNHDGQPDLAVANLGSNSVTILLGDGSGGFSAAGESPIAVATDPYTLAIGDFNGDTYQDLAMSSYTGSSVTILLGNGSGGFTATATPLSTGSSKPNTIALGDFDGDGQQDLVTGSTWDGKSYLFLGKGDGSFTQATGSPLSLGYGADRVMTADVNGDGKQDLVFASAAAGKLIVKLSNCRAASATTLAASSSTSVFGQSVTFTATISATTISGASGTPTGTVTFKDGNATLGTTLGTGTVNSGVATFATASLSAGNHSVTASYGGDSGYSPSDSSATTQTVNKATLTVTAQDKSRTYGAANPAFTATYSGFVNNDTASALSGEPSLTTVAMPTSEVGSYSITASAGTLSAANYAFTFVDGTLTVSRAATSTVLASSLTPTSYGQPITLTATVSSNSGAPTGNVQFFDGDDWLGAVPLNHGSASCPIASLAAANHSLVAVYVGDQQFDGSMSATITQTVNQAVSELTLGASANPAVWKQYLTFTATVSGVHGATVPTGTVIFSDETTVLGTATINSLGRASFSTSALATRSHTITAIYNGSANYLAATAEALELSVSKGLTATTLGSSANPASLSQPVTLTAKVLGTGGTPTGSVEFFAGNVSLGTAPLNGQSAALTTSTLSDTTNSLTAVYRGDEQFDASASTALTQMVVLYCTFNLSGLNQTFELTGGTGESKITTRGGCDWIATTTANWITLTGSGVRSGDGTVSFTVAPLSGGLARTGAITIAGQTVTIIQAKLVAVVSAASYNGLEVAPGAIVSLFGANLSTASETVSSLPLPTTLAGTMVKVTDSQGVSRLSPLFYVSPTQINYLIPADTALGAATITVVNDTEEVTGAGLIQIVAVSPGLFTANSSGQDVAAAVLFRLSDDGTQSYEAISQFDALQNKQVPLAIDLGPDTDQVFLLLFGTGLRHRTSLVGVTARIGNEEVEVLYAGAQGGFEGLDQVNLSLPRSLIGVGETNLVLTVDGKVVNTVRIKIQ